MYQLYLKIIKFTQNLNLGCGRCVMFELYIIFCVIFLIAFIGTAVILWILQSSVISGVLKNNEKLNLKVNENIKNTNFNITKVHYINDYASFNKPYGKKKIILIDASNRKMCLVDYKSGNMVIVNFDDLLNYEVYENGSNLTIGGGLGGYGVGIFGAETSGICKDLKLIIRLKSYDTPSITYEIIANTNYDKGIEKSTSAYKNCISTLQEFISFLEVIKNEKQTNQTNESI